MRGGTGAEADTGTAHDDGIGVVARLLGLLGRRSPSLTRRCQEATIITPRPWSCSSSTIEYMRQKGSRVRARQDRTGGGAARGWGAHAAGASAHAAGGSWAGGRAEPQPRVSRSAVCATGGGW
eukprot:3372415-Pleurochrysis_carterae.AAC.1